MTNPLAERAREEASNKYREKCECYPCALLRECADEIERLNANCADMLTITQSVNWASDEMLVQIRILVRERDAARAENKLLRAVADAAGTILSEDGGMDAISHWNAGFILRDALTAWQAAKGNTNG